MYFAMFTQHFCQDANLMVNQPIMFNVGSFFHKHMERKPFLR